MSRVISIHEYQLKPGADPQQFERAIQLAKESGLLELPGLVECLFVKGLRGQREGQYAFIWIYESREAWEKLWGPAPSPAGKDDYPHNWRIWEDRILAEYLDRQPDSVEFTAYEEVHIDLPRRLY